MLRNRVSAQQARERKKAYLIDLEARVKELETKNAELEERLSTLQNENQMLRHVCPNLTPFLSFIIFSYRFIVFGITFRIHTILNNIEFFLFEFVKKFHFSLCGRLTDSIYFHPLFYYAFLYIYKICI